MECLATKYDNVLDSVLDNTVDNTYLLSCALKDFKHKEDTESSYAFSAKENALFVNLYKMIAYTRNIGRGGLGKRDETYRQIAVWSECFPELAKYALTQCVNDYGCWRDIRQFCNYYKDWVNDPTLDFHSTNLSQPPIVEHCIKIMVHQLQTDYICMVTGNEVSNASKWCPREKNKNYGWLFSHIACEYTSADSPANTYKKFMRDLVALNKYNKITQVDFCKRSWSNITPSSISHKTYSKNKNGFHNLTSSGEIRDKADLDRGICAEKFFFYGNQFSSPSKVLDSVYLKSLFKHELVNKMVNVYNLDMRNHSQFESYDKAWDSNNEGNLPELNDFIPIIEISHEVHTPESKSVMINALTIAATILKQQSSVPDALHNGDTLRGHVANYDARTMFTQINCGSITNIMQQIVSTLDTSPHIAPAFDFSKFYEIFLTKLMYEKHHPDIANKKTLLFLCSHTDSAKIMEDIKKTYDSYVVDYHRVGIRLTGFPYTPPKIVIWNLGMPSGFHSPDGFSVGKRNVSNIEMINSCCADVSFNFLTKSFYETGKAFMTREQYIDATLAKYEEFNPFYI